MSAFIRSVKRTTPFVRSFSATATRSTLNKVQLIGRIGADPTVNEFGDRRVYNYTVATSETRPDKTGDLVKRTQWHRVAYWTNADWFDKVKKGDQVYVEGSLRYNDYVDKDGNARTKAEIQQNGFKLLSSSRKGEDEEEE